VFVAVGPSAAVRRRKVDAESFRQQLHVMTVGVVGVVADMSLDLCRQRAAENLLSIDPPRDRLFVVPRRSIELDLVTATALSQDDRVEVDLATIGVAQRHRCRPPVPDDAVSAFDECRDDVVDSSSVDDQVEIGMRSVLLTNKSIDSPSTVDPRGNAERGEVVKNVEDLITPDATSMPSTQPARAARQVDTRRALERRLTGSGGVTASLARASPARRVRSRRRRRPRS